MQNNIIEFVPKNKEEEAEVNNTEEFIKSIAPDTDQIIFVRVNKEGNISLGHSPLAMKDLIVMYYQINRYIDILLESEGEMYVPPEIDE
jgi:hypothetical protein